MSPIEDLRALMVGPHAEVAAHDSQVRIYLENLRREKAQDKEKKRARREGWDERERQVLIMHEDKRMSFVAIGKELGITNHRARQIYERAAYIRDREKEMADLTEKQ